MEFLWMITVLPPENVYVICFPSWSLSKTLKALDSSKTLLDWTEFKYRNLLYLHIKESSLSKYQVYTTGSLPGLPIEFWKQDLVSLFKNNKKTTPWINWSPRLWVSTIFLTELTGSQPQGGEGMSAHTPPKHIWETDESLDNRDESSPLTRLTSPTCPFLSLMWVNEEVWP